jgi:hypothetical protein
MMAQRTGSVSSISSPSRGRRVQIGINDLKGAIDGTLADSARLMADMIVAGQEAQVLPQVSQRALERMHECIKAGIEMRSLAIAMHHDLRKIMGQVDLQAVGFGDLGDSPDLFTRPVSRAGDI